MIYLASPYSDPDPAVKQARYDAAVRAVGALMARGETVYSRIVSTHAPRRPAFAPRRKAAALWDEGNAAKCAGSLKIYRKP